MLGIRRQRRYGGTVDPMAISSSHERGNRSHGKRDGKRVRE